MNDISTFPNLLAGAQESLFVFEDALGEIEPAAENLDAEFLFLFGVPRFVKVVTEFLDFADFVTASGEQIGDRKSVV